jgi:RNA polymerase sigma-70 factor (ECF subfamily)
MIDLRIDPRLHGRFDPSDILQDVYIDAFKGLKTYVDDPRLPFFLWLRGLTSHRVGRIHRDHLGRQARDASREVSLYRDGGPGASSAAMADEIVARDDRPSEVAMKAERRDRLRDVLDRMGPLDREILALRHFEQLNRSEAAQVLGLSESSAAKRYFRAVGRLREAIDRLPGGTEGLLP